MRKWFRFTRRAATVIGAFGLTAASIVVTSTGTASGAVTKTVITTAGTGGIAPTYIFPFLSETHESNENLFYLQKPMYRPLYPPGDHNKVTVTMKLALADPPKFSNGDKTVTVTLKPYKWSDGEQVDSTDIMLWLNMWHRQPTAFFEWAPGGNSIPTVLASVQVTTPTTVVMTLNHALNKTFFLDNELGTITPLPMAWTVTSLTAAPGTGGCAKAPFATTTPTGAGAAKCKAVYDFLSEQAGFNPTNPKETINAQPGYATSKLWSVVDGPFRLSSYIPTGGFTMVPNLKYSGPNKPHIREYIDKTYTSTAAMFDALASGTLDIGILPLTDDTSPAKKPGTPGHLPVPGSNNPRLTSNYDLEPTALWGFTYMEYNFKSTFDTGEAGPILSQLYVRQALQHLNDEPLFVSRIDKNYGMENYGPEPASTSPFLSPKDHTDPYPYSPAAAKALLESHGWKVVPGGTDTCQKPGTGAGECGKGIRKGAKLLVTLMYASTPTTLKTMMESIKGAASEVGININLTVASFDTVIGESVSCPKGCKWDISDFGGWTYTHPDPTGTELFATGASSNAGSFLTMTSTSLIKKTLTGGTTAYEPYANWEEQHLPVGFEDSAVRLYEVHKGLTGVAPMSTMDMPTPATYQWSSGST